MADFPTEAVPMSMSTFIVSPRLVDLLAPEPREANLWRSIPTGAFVAMRIAAQNANRRRKQRKGDSVVSLVIHLARRTLIKRIRLPSARPDT
jgi:hypothetical protein